jgi:hypothetical protein
MTENIFLEDEI